MSIVYRRPTPQDMPQFHRVVGDVFGSNPTPESMARYEQFGEADRLWAAFDEGAGEGSGTGSIVATHGTYSLEMSIPGNQMRVGGTTIVTVLPTHRRRGIFRYLMTQHLREVHEQGEPIAALWASEYKIYGRFGFGLATDKMTFELAMHDARLRDLPASRGSLRFVEFDSALTAFPKIFEQARLNRPGMYKRTAAWWEHRTLYDPVAKRDGVTGHKRVIYSRDGVDCGYVLYRIERRKATDVRDHWLVVDMIELVAVDDEAELALWRYILSIDLAGVVRSGEQPTDCKLLWWLENQRAIDRRVSDGLWVRVVDLPTALEQRRYSEAGQVTFRFDDEICPWNTGTYRLTVDESGAASVDASTDTAAVEITPFALGSIYMGGRCLRDLAVAGFASGSKESLALLDKMFRWYPAPWCQEVF